MLTVGDFTRHEVFTMKTQKKEIKIDNRQFDRTKYTGPREFRERISQLYKSGRQIDFSDDEKEAMLHEMIKYINSTDCDLYNDFMDEIMDSKPDWFNFICFDRRTQKYLQTYIKVRVQQLRTNHTGYDDIGLTITDKCYRSGVLVPMECDSCSLNMGVVCAGSGKRLDNGECKYGMPIDEAIAMFPNGCDEYSISFPSYCILEDKYWEED